MFNPGISRLPKSRAALAGAIAAALLSVGNARAETSVAVAHSQSDPGEYPLRLSLAAHEFAADPEQGWPDDQPPGATFEIAVFPSSRFGVAGFVGRGPAVSPDFFYGGELEYLPVQLGAFGLSGRLQAGLLLGASNLGHESIPTLWGTIHGGARVILNLGERFGLTGSLRANLDHRRDYAYLMGGAGLAVRF